MVMAAIAVVTAAGINDTSAVCAQLSTTYKQARYNVNFSYGGETMHLLNKGWFCSRHLQIETQNEKIHRRNLEHL